MHYLINIFIIQGSTTPEWNINTLEVYRSGGFLCASLVCTNQQYRLKIVSQNETVHGVLRPSILGQNFGSQLAPAQKMLGANWKKVGAKWLAIPIQNNTFYRVGWLSFLWDREGGGAGSLFLSRVR